MKKLLLVGLLGCLGCTDAARSGIYAYGKEGKVLVYSGGEVVREYTSTGKIETLDKSDGWEFRDKATGKFVRVTGTVVIEQ